jgi:hypothetical protein
MCIWLADLLSEESHREEQGSELPGNLDWRL